MCRSEVDDVTCCEVMVFDGAVKLLEGGSSFTLRERDYDAKTLVRILS